MFLKTVEDGGSTYEKTNAIFYAKRKKLSEDAYGYGVWEDREKIVMLQLSSEIWTILWGRFIF